MEPFVIHFSFLWMYMRDASDGVYLHLNNPILQRVCACRCMCVCVCVISIYFSPVCVYVLL